MTSRLKDRHDAKSLVRVGRRARLVTELSQDLEERAVTSGRPR